MCATLGNMDISIGPLCGRGWHDRAHHLYLRDLRGHAVHIDPVACLIAGTSDCIHGDVLLLVTITILRETVTSTLRGACRIVERRAKGPGDRTF